jgi:hypothetical protein
MSDKPKVAFCLHGLAAGKNFKHGGLEVTFEAESDLYKQHILGINNCDVFMHSWSVDVADQLKEIYQPRKALFQNSEVFFTPTLGERFKDFKKKLRGKTRELYRVNNIYSRWATFKRAVDLVGQYEEENGVRYDFIMVSRFDMSLFTDIDFSQLDPEKFYAGRWVGFRDTSGKVIPEEKTFSHPDKFFRYERGFPTTNEGLSDFWFIASADNMKRFAQIFDELEQLIPKTATSNHKIALEKVRQLGLIPKLEFMLEFSKDYQLTRWLN